MEYFESQKYRDSLAAEIKSAPRDMRKAILEEARQSTEYIETYIAHKRPRWDQREQSRKDRIEATRPDLNFDFSNEADLQANLLKLGEWVYATTSGYDRVGGYDPYKGHMLCGEITDRFISSLHDKGVEARRIERIYEIKDPGGKYNDSFGHVYLMVNFDKEHILIDPTYLQWVSEKEREGLPPVLIIRFKDLEDFRGKFKNVPIEGGMILPFYLGFNSQEAKEYFKNNKYSVTSDERARIDN